MREGFSSVHKGIMHTCGHDGHTAIGLAVAETIACLKEKDEESDKHLLCGTIKLIFQPAEEGGRGALPIVKKGLLDDVDIFISGHIGLNANKTGLIATGTYDWFASTKMTVLFKGESAHAGAKPEEGKNAMLAAATVILNLHAISRHSGGATRINVGIIKGGTSRNIICDEVEMKIQTRGITTGLDNYMRDRAFKIINSAAEMYEVKSDIVINGISISVDSDKKFANKLTSFIKTISEVTEIKEMMVPGGGEDANYYIDHVQKYGGKATYMLYGSNLEASHHARNFDFDEKTLKIASKVLCTSMINLLSLEN
jgi:aminobenzoyl-glutamate utilization protein A